MREREAESGKCKQCKHQFVFDPRRTTGDLFNDKLFERSLTLISVNNTLKFTPGQYHYFLNRMKAISGPEGGVGCLVYGFAILMWFMSTAGGHWQLGLAFGIGLSIIATLLLPQVQRKLGWISPRQVRVFMNTSRLAFERWEKVNGAVASLLPEPSKTLPRGDVAKELLDYSFDRVVVTETDSIAQFLIANNFHFENNCAVLSINKYPSNLFETVMMMLRNNPELKVYALHNCSVEGVKLPDRLRSEPDWFKDQPVQIIDLGLLPRQVMGRRAFVEFDAANKRAFSSLPETMKKTLTDKELRFFEEGNMVALESITPRALLRMVSLGIAMSKDPSKKDALVPVSDSGTGSGDAGTGDGGIWIFSTDTFG